MQKHYLHGFEVSKKDIKKLNKKYFELIRTEEDLYGNKQYHYEFKGYRQPLLCVVTDSHCMVYSPYSYMGNYTYNNEDEIRLHSTYGRVNTYKKITLFGQPFMVDTRLSDEDVALAVETDKSFVKSLLKAL